MEDNHVTSHKYIIRVAGCRSVGRIAISPNFRQGLRGRSRVDFKTSVFVVVVPNNGTRNTNGNRSVRLGRPLCFVRNPSKGFRENVFFVERKKVGLNGKRSSRGILEQGEAFTK